MTGTDATGTATLLPDDAALVRRAQRGDGAAFEELYRRHAQPAWRLASPNRAALGSATPHLSVPPEEPAGAPPAGVFCSSSAMTSACSISPARKPNGPRPLL